MTPAAGPDRRLAEARSVASQARPGEEIEVYCARAVNTRVRVFGGEVESLSRAETEGMGIRVICDHRQGFAWAGSLDSAVVAETLADARDNASFATPDDQLGLAVPDGVIPVPLEHLWREEVVTTPTETKVAMALELERRLRAADGRIRQVPDASYGDDAVETVVVTSTGIEAASRRTRCSVSAEALAGDGDDTQTGYGYSVGRAPADLDLDRASEDAARRAIRMLGARKPPSAHVTIVMEPEVTAAFLGVLAGTLSGDAVLKRRSLFTDRLGEDVSVPALELVEDPTNGAALGAAPVDAEGLATRRTALIQSGVLASFLYDTYAARRARVSSTGSAVRNGFKSTPGAGARALALTPGPTGPDEIIRSVTSGLLVQSVVGLHSGVNPISGDFSVGAEGLLIRDGELAEPVREITIASTIQRMLKDVVAIGNDIEWLPAAAAGVTLAVAGISMSGA